MGAAWNKDELDCPGHFEIKRKGQGHKTIWSKSLSQNKLVQKCTFSAKAYQSTVC